MIELSVTTKLRFETEEEFQKFLEFEVSKVVGFRSEIEAAYKKKSLLEVKTPLVQYGTMTTSEIYCMEVV